MKTMIKNKTMAAVIFVVYASTAFAVARPTVEITKISVEDNVYTPYYQVQTVLDNQQGSSQKWLQLHVEYTTSGGWIDELKIEQSVIVTDKDLDKPIILDEDVTYINIKPGDHYANVYMHPSLVKRYGIDSSDVDSAAVFRVGGQVVAKIETNLRMKKGWLEEHSATITHKGHLLNHSETPFWFINYDFKEIIKKRGPHAHERSRNEAEKKEG